MSVPFHKKKKVQKAIRLCQTYKIDRENDRNEKKISSFWTHVVAWHLLRNIFYRRGQYYVKSSSQQNLGNMFYGKTEEMTLKYIYGR